jgi:hypothetical protein
MNPAIDAAKRIELSIATAKVTIPYASAALSTSIVRASSDYPVDPIDRF